MTTTALWSSLVTGSDANPGSRRTIYTIYNDAQTQIRATFQSTLGSTPMVLDHASIGIWAGTGLADTTATPVELTFNNGQSGFNLAGNSQITSDWVNFSGFNTSNKLVLIQDINAGGGEALSSGVGITATDTIYHNTDPGAASYNIAAVNPTGWVGPSVDFNLSVVAIEVRGGTGPQTIASQFINTTSGGMSGSARQIIPLTLNGGDQVRLTMSSCLAAGGTITLDHVSVGVWAGSSADTKATPVEVKFGGLSGCTLAANGNMTVSDWVDLTGFTSSDHLVVIMDVNVAGGPLAFSRPSGWTDVWDNTPGAVSYNLATTPGGYTPFVDWDFFVALVEERVNAPPPPPTPVRSILMPSGLVLMTAPEIWPFPTPVVPGSVTATGRSYHTEFGSQVIVHPADITSLLSLGFTLGGFNQPQGVSVSLSSAHILTLFSKPVLLVPAQGPNTIIVPQFMMLTASSGATYTFGGTIGLYMGTTQDTDYNMPSTAPLDTNPGQAFSYSNAVETSLGHTTTTAFADLPLYLASDTSDPTGGTKSATFAITYSVFPIATPA